jgi:hypothetical protein
MKGDQIIIDILIQTADVSTIRKLCNKAEEYSKQANLQYEENKQEIIAHEVEESIEPE